MKPKTKRFLVLLETIMLLLWIVTTCIFLYAVFSKGARCMANPLVYGSKVLTDKNNVEFTCYCSFENNPQYTIFVDKDHWEMSQKQHSYTLNFPGG
jgi:hypothetical protein